MSRTLSTGIAMASLLFAACGIVDASASPGEGTPSGEGSNVAASAPNQLLGPGEPCGGIQGNRVDCGKGFYCAYAIAAQCGAGDQQGVCTAMPELCASGINYAPVCGCDGATYDGGCQAALASTSVQRVGACDQNITGSWSFLADRQYNYTFDPAGTFTREIRPVCASDAPCPLPILQSSGSYNLQGTALNLAYTSPSDTGMTALFTIRGTDPAEHLQGNDSGVAVDLTRAAR